ncbi:hypothetical protein [Polaromonas sp. CG9_12]|nr:hypothetical protein [Polaromonas sp. CG9_12]
MELKLYQQLKAELLGSLAPASEWHDDAYQHAVERYAPEAESGIKKWGRDAIADWLARYNALVSRPVRLRYYQILALYFTEGVLREQRDNPAAPRRNLLAYWMATGSGKTLLMHLNILQYIEHIGGLHAFDELQLVLTTPGVNLIEQHRREITPIVEALNRQCAGGIKLTVESTGSLLNHEPGFFKLTPSSRVFRLVLVDEGHIGLAGGGKEAGAFKTLRHELADYPNAFLFEYSATYHGISDKHVAEYGEQIVYDYNYYRFYKDGYGKDYGIQKIGADSTEQGAEAWANFMAAFATLAGKLTVFDELRLQDDAGLGFTAAFTDKPLIAFMGNTVEDKKDEGKLAKSGAGDEVSDIRKLLAFLAKLTPAQRQSLGAVFNQDSTGLLTLTRSPAVADEIFLSWGDGGYWGIVNVGNGDKFFNDCENHPELQDAHGQSLVQLRKAAIVERRCQFTDIDLPDSPINVLVGSRKFAEGWNCYRVSVIGLINLGSSKGNKIIQIFGRGVRLKGLKGDGKRRFIAHGESYDDLVADDSPENRLRRLETLNIFSLRATYLSRFLDALAEEIPRWVEARCVPVVAQSLRLGKPDESFADYAPKLPIFKVGRDTTEPRLVVTRQTDGTWQWAYLQEGREETGVLSRFSAQLDYRPEVTQTPHNLAQDLREHVQTGAVPSAFVGHTDLHTRLQALLRTRNTQLLAARPEGARLLSPADVLSVLDSVDYHRPWAGLSFAHKEKLVWQALADAVAQLHHKLIYDINKRRYRFGEPLVQSVAGAPGDFISHYDLRIEFDKPAGQTAFNQTYPDPQYPEQLKLVFEEPRHLYAPLLRDGQDRAVQALPFKTLHISPDALNPGERKFVEDLHGFLENPVNQGRLRGFTFYLMRNVESLRSVGVYLDTETRAYFPDFVLWAVGKRLTHILLVDPKGQSGLQDWCSLERVNAKVALAHSGDLPALALALGRGTGRPFKVDSFILLRKSSPLGKPKNGSSYDPKVVADMERKHVLHLNWAPEVNGKRVDEDGDKVILPPDGRCYVERMLTCAGLPKPY